MTEQARGTVSPAMTGNKGEGVRKMMAGSVEEMCMLHL